VIPFQRVCVRRERVREILRSHLTTREGKDMPHLLQWSRKRGVIRYPLAGLAAAVVVLAVSLPPAAAQELPKEIVDAAKKEGKVMIYGSIESEIMKAAQTAFEAKYGIKTDYWRASSSRVMDRVLTESRAGKPLFDVVLTNATPMKILKQEGTFARYVAPTSASFPDKVRDKEGVLSPPYRVVVVGVLYNPRLVKAEEAPKTLKDLLDPKWRGKIVLLLLSL